MKTIALTNDTDFYRTPMLSDLDTGKRVRFEPLRIHGKGWTVAKVVGSNKTGKTIEVAEGFEGCDTYTLAQAQLAASNHTRDVYQTLYQNLCAEAK